MAVRVPGAQEWRGTELGQEEAELVGHAVQADSGHAPAGLQEETVAEGEQEAAGPGELVRHAEAAQFAHHLEIEVDARLPQQPDRERPAEQQVRDQGAEEQARPRRA